MQRESLTTLVEQHLDAASRHPAGRAQEPGEATRQVLHGLVTLAARDDVGDGSVGDLITTPAARHSLEAVEDSAIVGSWSMRNDCERYSKTPTVSGTGEDPVAVTAPYAGRHVIGLR